MLFFALHLLAAQKSGSSRELYEWLPFSDLMLSADGRNKQASWGKGNQDNSGSLLRNYSTGSTPVCPIKERKHNAEETL